MTAAGIFPAGATEADIEALILTLARCIGEGRGDPRIDQLVQDLDDEFGPPWIADKDGAWWHFTSALLLGIARLRASGTTPACRRVVVTAEGLLAPGAFTEIDRIRRGAVEARIAGALAAGLPVLEPGGLVALAESDLTIARARATR